MHRTALMFAVAMVAGLSWAHAETLSLPESAISLASPEGQTLLLEAEAQLHQIPVV